MSLIFARNNFAELAIFRVICEIYFPQNEQFWSSAEFNSCEISHFLADHEIIFSKKFWIRIFQ